MMKNYRNLKYQNNILFFFNQIEKKKLFISELFKIIWKKIGELGFVINFNLF